MTRQQMGTSIDGSMVYSSLLVPQIEVNIYASFTEFTVLTVVGGIQLGSLGIYALILVHNRTLSIRVTLRLRPCWFCCFPLHSSVVGGSGSFPWSLQSPIFSRAS